MRRLLEAWGDARGGLGRTVVISGEPGVGKSRLLASLQEALASEPHRWLALRCSPLRIEHGLPPGRRHGSGEPGNPAHRRARGAAAHDHARRCPTDRPTRRCRSRPCWASTATALPAPEKFRRDLMEALHCWLVELARERPIVVAGEDLHWSDPSTLELMRLLQGRLAGAPVLIVATRRPEGAPGLAADVEVDLDRLDAEQARTLARGLAAARGLGTGGGGRGGRALRRRAAVRGGAGRGSGRGRRQRAADLPAELAAGAPRPARSRRATWPRSPPCSGAASPSGCSPRPRTSQPTGWPTRSASSPPRASSRAADSVDGRRYEFRHALIRDAAYESLLRRSRVQLHRLVASVLEEQFPEHARGGARAARPPPRPGRRAVARGGMLRGRRPPRRGLGRPGRGGRPLPARDRAAGGGRAEPRTRPARDVARHPAGQRADGARGPRRRQPAPGLEQGHRAGRAGRRRRRADRGAERPRRAGGGQRRPRRGDRARPPPARDRRRAADPASRACAATGPWGWRCSTAATAERRSSTSPPRSRTTGRATSRS